ncbi:MAG: hypothetical protein R3B84_24030 [Zavarzinella sp.]
MGFFSGRATITRFTVLGQPPELFEESHLAMLAENSIGRQRLLSADGVDTGWCAAGHILDTQFEYEKNIINDMLFFSMRMDTTKLPGDLLRAYYEIDLAALIKSNPSGFASTRQKKEARESARDRLEQEAKDGRFTKRKAIECVWERQSNELWFGTSSSTAIDRLGVLFKNTFGYHLELVSSGRRAYQIAEAYQQTRAVDDASLSPFVPSVAPKEVSWIADEANRDFAGNEFLIWLWFMCHDDEETFKGSDGSEITVMMTRSLTLECPRGMTGSETFTHEAPTILPEALRGLQGGKLPRKAGITIVRHQIPYEISLLAEPYVISAAKIPPPEDDPETELARVAARSDQLRHLVETFDLLYEQFCIVRFGGDWSKMLAKMQQWLKMD